MAILPMDLHLNLLMKNSALRLYRLPRESQLLKRLGGEWSGPREGDLPLPCTPARNRCTHTRLTALAQLAPADGPRLRPHALPPWGHQNWGACLSQDPRVRLQDERAAWVAQLKTDMSSGQAITIFCRGTVSNHNREDNLPVGTASSVAYLEGRELRHTECLLGTTVTGFDAELAALETRMLLAQTLLTTRPTLHILLLCSDPFAISAIFNYGPHPGQRFSLSFKQITDNLLSLNRELRIAVSWAPQDRALVGFAHACHLMNTIAANPFPANHREPLSISYQ
ncbi:hypothetical protein BJV78DRAFT_1334564 [Lactifluus subvellereus]|nr:hypothetical protein BJV78DRAFT_1334564 [Lactifluus subvellereus]